MRDAVNHAAASSTGEPGGLRRHMDYGYQRNGLGGSMRMESTPEQRAAGGQLPPFGLGLPVEVGGLGGLHSA